MTSCVYGVQDTKKALYINMIVFEDMQQVTLSQTLSYNDTFIYKFIRNKLVLVLKCVAFLGSANTAKQV